MNGTNEERNVGQKVDKKEIGIDFEKEGMGWKKKIKAFSINFAQNRARGNRKTLKWLTMLTKCNFRNLKLKSHEEYLIEHILLCKRLDTQAKSKSQKRRTKR